MLETVTMWTTGENIFDHFEEIFLMIGKENKSFVHERLKCMALNHGQKKLQEPEPIIVGFSSDNSMSKREQTTIGIHRSSSEKNS